ncbi:MAG: hypothetical protein IKD89_04795, partial [Clostridia bacterium]|nr:hypothetical protein [Clostridia bacterium]
MKRIISLTLALCMVIGMFSVQAFAEDTPEPAGVLPTAQLPEMEYVEGMSYAGFATVQSELPEEGLYTLTIRRTGDLGAASAVVVETVDVSARYGVDYEFTDDVWSTETLETSDTLLELSGDEANRNAANAALLEIQNNLAACMDGGETTAPASVPEGDSLAALKARQSGLPVRDTYESEEISLAESLVRELDMDIADYVETSSKTRVSFAPGETEQTLCFRIIEDNDSEGQELFNLLLSGDDESTAVIETARSISFTIADDEPIEHSVMTLSDEEYIAKNGKITVTITRDTAVYSYVTVRLRAVSNPGDSATEGEDYSAADLEVAFAPYQDTAAAEIPVSAGSREKSFTIELYDIKGGDPGDIMSARAIIPASDGTAALEEADDSYLAAFPSDGALIGGYPHKVTVDKQYDIVYSDNIGYIKDKDDIVGLYIAPKNMSMFTALNAGNGYHTAEVKNDTNNYLHLYYYSGWIGDIGSTGVQYKVPNPNSYRLLMLDMSTDSIYQTAARMGFSYKTTNAGGGLLRYDTKEVGGTNARKTRLATALYTSNSDGYSPYPWAAEGKLNLFVARRENLLCAPEANFYGIILMYKEYHITAEDPAPLSYRSGALNADGSPVMESLKPASMTVVKDIRYAGQTIQLIETPAAGNEAVYGTLKGYNIKPLKGTAFFYSSNNLTLNLNDDLIRKIDEHTTRLQNGNAVDNDARLAYTQITIQPVYEYKNVKMGLYTPEGLPDGAEYHYLDRDLEAQRASGAEYTYDVFHVGDKLNLTMTTEEPGYYLSRCWREQYLNPGDESYVDDRSGDLPIQNGIVPTPVIVLSKCKGRGTFTNMKNFIDVQLDANAQKYFTVDDIVPDDRLTESYMKGRNVLNTAKQSGDMTRPRAYSFEPVSSNAYTVNLSSTDENDGTWRPVITVRKTGQTVQGFSADFIAGPLAADNIIKVTAQKIDPADYAYFSIDGKAVYESYALRPGSETVNSSPAAQAVVTGGGGGKLLWKNVYDDNWNVTSQYKTYTAVRASAVTGDDGTFTLGGIYAIPGDTVSVLVDNNDVRHVEYVTLNSAFPEERAYAEISPSDTTNDQGLYYNEATQKTGDVFVNDVSRNMVMPICTYYSPHAVNVYYAYKDHFTDSRYNQVPIYNDELTLSVIVKDMGADISDVTVTKVGRNGYRIPLSAVKDPSHLDVWNATFGGGSLVDADRFYVQITATPAGGDAEITYTSLDTGLVLYTPKQEDKPQYMNYPIPNPYKDLPLIGSMAGSADTGKLTWKTIYADESEKNTSNYAQLVTLSIDSKSIMDDCEKLNELSTGKQSDARKTWRQMINDNESDVVKYLDANERAQLISAYRKANPASTATDKEIIDNFNKDPAQKYQYRYAIEQGAMMDSLCKTGDAKIEAGMQVLLQLEYTYDVNKRTHFYSGGQYIIAFTTNVGKTWYTTLYGIPVFLNLSGNMSLQFDGRYATEQGKITAKEMGYYEDLTEAIQSEWPWFQFGLGIKLQPGVGICGILAARGFVDFKFVGRINIEDENLGGTLGDFGGGFGIDLLIFSFDYKIGSIGWKTGVFETGKLTAAEESGDTVSLRTFDAERERRPKVMSTLGPTAKTTLVSGSMEYARPELLDLGDGRIMLLFLRSTNDDGRSEADASTLVYSIRGADGKWPLDENGNILSKQIETDGAADSTPAALRIGDKVYAAWTSAGVTLGEEGEIGAQSAKNALKSTNIRMAVYDVKTGKFTAPIEVTRDGFVNSHPMLVREGDRVALYYFKRDIDGADSVEDLVGLTNNYNSWAKKVYDPAKNAFVELVPGDKNPTEEYIYIRHPSLVDPLVTDLDAADFAYTDRSGETKDYRFVSYSVDRDGSMTTTVDRELWVQVSNITDGRVYYPIPIDANRDGIFDQRLTKIGDDVYLSWLCRDTVINTISARTIFEGLDAEDGTGGEAQLSVEAVSGLECIRTLSDAEISKNGWYKLPIEQVGGLTDENREKYGTLTKLAACGLVNATKDFGSYSPTGEHEGMTLSDHQIVAGDDGNIYLFWTSHDNDDLENDNGRELYGAALAASNQNMDGADSRVMMWSDAVKLTEYGKVIDELTLCVTGDGSAVMAANLYEQAINEEGDVEYSDHELVQIDFTAGNSLSFENGTVMLSDMYPVEGERVTARLGIVNDGLLPAQKYALTVNGENTTVTDNPIYPGDTASIIKEFTAGAGGALSVSAQVEEILDTQALALWDEGDNTASVSTLSGAVLDLGQPTIYDYEDEIAPMLEAGKESVKVGAVIHHINLIDELDDIRFTPVDLGGAFVLQETGDAFGEREISITPAADYVALVPVTNMGNLDGHDLTIEAVVLDEQWKDMDVSESGVSSTTEMVRGGVVGTGGLSVIPVKTLDENGDPVTETVYAAVPLTDLDPLAHVNEMGVMTIEFDFALDGVPLEETKAAKYQIRENIELKVNGGVDTVVVHSGSKAQLEVEALPWDGIKEISYVVEDPTIAAVSEDGVVAGLKAGTTTLYIEDESTDSLKKSIKLTVTGSGGGSGGGGGGGSSANTSPVSIGGTGENGTVTVSRANAAAGQLVTVTATPKEGYKTAKVTVTDKSGNNVAVTKNADGTYSFTMPASEVTITPTFVKSDGSDVTGC